MNNPSFNKKVSKSSISVEYPDRVEAQLARRRKAKSEVVSPTVTDRASDMEIIPVATLPPVEEAHVVDTGTAGPAQMVPELQLRTAERAHRKMVGKVKRAFLKAGVEAGPEAQAAFLNDLLMANVPVLNRSSGRIARVVRGEQSIASLLLVRIPKKSA